MDLSQNLDRTRIQSGSLACMHTSSIFWLVDGRRTITGREMMAVQGLSKASLTTGTPDALLRDLAGNSFNASCVMAVFASLFG